VECLPATAIEAVEILPPDPLHGGTHVTTGLDVAVSMLELLFFLWREVAPQIGGKLGGMESVERLVLCLERRGGFLLRLGLQPFPH
jgi:hypothetical protein